MTARIGIAFFDEGDDLQPDRTLVAADRAMYEAKQAGRDRVVVAARRQATGAAG
jgi:PleD family two-component response regulator